MSPHTESRLGLTVSEAAEHLGVSIGTVRRWSNAGFIQTTRTPGGQRRFTTGQLDEFMESLAPREPSPSKVLTAPRAGR